MSEDYVHAKIEAQVEGGSNKAVLVILDGVKKWLAYSKILSLDVSRFTDEGVEQVGTVSVEDFKKGIKTGRKIYLNSVEIDRWLATEIHELEIIED